MMPRIRAWTTVLAVCALLTGCWDKAELTERAFVQAVALDIGEDDKLELTVLFYRPLTNGGSGSESAQSGGASFMITTKGANVFEAIRDVPIRVGRKAKWDHMRAIMIGEDVARKAHIGHVLDFFRRDHEPRLTSSVMITKGRAASYLRIKPFIESTIAQQIREVERYSMQFAAKTLDTLLLDVSIGLRSETGIAEVAYLYSTREKADEALVAGLSLINIHEPGKFTVLPPDRTQLLLMLRNQFRNGIITAPCDTDSDEMESVEIIRSSSKMKPSVKDGELKVNVFTKLEGDIGELSCSDATDSEGTRKMERQLERTVKQHMDRLLKLLQEKKLDAIDLGDKLYRAHPFLWKKWKEDWPERFARTPFEFHIEAHIRNSGSTVGKPSI